MKEDTKKFWRELMSGGYRASAIGLTLVIAIFIGFFLGYWLDNALGTGFFKWIGLIIGIIAGFRQVYLMGQKYSK